MREKTTAPLLAAQKRPGEFVPGVWYVRHQNRLLRLGCLIKFDFSVFCANNCGTHIKNRFILLHNPDMPVTKREFIYNHNIPVDFFERSHYITTEHGRYDSNQCINCEQE